MGSGSNEESEVLLDIQNSSSNIEVLVVLISVIDLHAWQVQLTIT